MVNLERRSLPVIWDPTELLAGPVFEKYPASIWWAAEVLTFSIVVVAVIKPMLYRPDHRLSELILTFRLPSLHEVSPELHTLTGQENSHCISCQHKPNTGFASTITRPSRVQKDCEVRGRGVLSRVPASSLRLKISSLYCRIYADVGDSEHSISMSVSWSVLPLLKPVLNHFR